MVKSEVNYTRCLVCKLRTGAYRIWKRTNKDVRTTFAFHLNVARHILILNDNEIFNSEVVKSFLIIKKEGTRDNMDIDRNNYSKQGQIDARINGNEKVDIYN